MKCRILVMVGLLGALGFSALSLSSRVEAQQDEARARFERGVALFDEGRHDAALAEFEEAYRIAPSYQVLFNLGQVRARLGHAVEAVDAYERYLSEGGERVAAERRALVERELETERARIGSLAIEVGVDGAAVSVDGNFVARTPLAEPIRVAVGDHVVEVSAGGYESQQRRVAVAGGVVQRVTFALSETGAARGTIRISSALRDVEISVDGEVVGRTPLESSLSVPPGLREVRATRPGYQPFRRSVEVGMGAEAEIALELALDPSATAALGQLRLSVPLGASVFVDGAAVDPADAITLPQGDHELRVEMPDAVPLVERVTINPQRALELEPALRYTPSARAARIADASGQRTAGGALMIVGGLFLAGGGAVTIWNEVRRNDLAFDERRALITRCNDMVASPPDECFGSVIPVGTPSVLYPDEIERAQSRFNSDVDEFNGISALGYTLIGLGAVSLAVSVIVLVSAPSDEDATMIRVGVGPRGIDVVGTF